MSGRIVLVSDDPDFFEYISSKLLLRKSDIFSRLGFDDIPKNLDKLQNSLLIINSENYEEQTLSIIELSLNSSIIVFAYNVDENFKISVYNKGGFSLITPMTPDEEFKAVVISSLRLLDVYDKNLLYQEMLVKKGVINNNEVLLDYNAILDNELDKLRNKFLPSVLVAISPDDTTKFL